MSFDQLQQMSCAIKLMTELSCDLNLTFTIPTVNVSVQTLLAQPAGFDSDRINA